MAFHDVRLPEDVEIGARGGPKFQTTVTSLSSGSEQRNQDWSQQRCEYDISYGIQSLEDFNAVRDFFYARRGRFHGFRFKDWADYTLNDEVLGTGDGTEDLYQIVKNYEASGPLPYSRRITRPITNTLVVTLDNVETSAYTMDALGVINFTSNVGMGVVVRVSGEFDVPVRFDTDKYELTIEAFEAGVLPSLLLLELRE